MDQQLIQLRAQLAQLLDLANKAKDFEGLVQEFQSAGLSSVPIPTKEQLEFLDDAGFEYKPSTPKWLITTLTTIYLAVEAPAQRAINKYRYGLNTKGSK